MTLLEFLQLPHRFGWGGANGRDDCLTFLARWAQVVTGIDPVAHLRGTYHTAAQAGELIAEYGGIVPLVTLYAEPLGAWRVDALHAELAGEYRNDDFRDGDIGIIRAPAGMDGYSSEMGAVRFGPLWASIGLGGVIAKRADCVAAWRLFQ